MRPVSAAWLRTVAGSYTPITRITLCEAYQTGTSPVGDRLSLIDGTVDLDGAADLYATASLTFPGELWDALRPDGVEVYVQTGIRYSDSLVELVGLGYLRVRLPSQREAHRGGEITVTGEDRNATLARADLLRPRVFSPDTTNGEMVEALVTEVFPAAVIEWDDEVEHSPIGRQIVVDQYRLAALTGVATATGKIMRWDHRGVLTFRTPVGLLDPGASAVRLATGRRGVLAAVSREVADADVVNAVVVRGDGADQTGAAYGLAVDNDPRSPTRYGGRFGPAPRIVTNSLVTTDSQASIAARAELSRAAGLTHTLGLTISPRPELEPDDLVEIEHDHGVGRHLLASLSIPLVPGGRMRGMTRQQSLVPGEHS